MPAEVLKQDGGVFGVLMKPPVTIAVKTTVYGSELLSRETDE